MFDCCKELVDSINENEFELYEQYRGVCYYYKKNNDEYGQYFMCFCPFCGEKMPPNLYGSDIYCDALEKAVGKEYCDITEDEIPEEFKSDEWWKKRGL